MKWISLVGQRGFVQIIFLFSLLGVCLKVSATAPTSYRQPHPVAWMHQLPTGEMPGWSGDYWFELETGVANVWNAPLRMTDTRNNRELEYMADFEQFTAIAQFGMALSERIGVTVEVPYAYRDGGFMDHFIDAFHLLLKNRRYNRQYYDEYQDIYSVKEDGVEYFENPDPLREISNLKLKIKAWLLKITSQDKKSCPCGLSVSGQVKFPLHAKDNLGTTGDEDFSALLHLGIPIGDSSALWMTGGVTWLGDNPSMRDWPRKKLIELYEMNLDIGFTKSLGLILSVRAESPFLDVNHLRYEDSATDPEIISRNRAASGWNSLVRWRGSNALGARYRTAGGGQWQILLSEDWGIGPYDASDNIYSNGAPDINLVLQTRIDF